MVPKITNRTGNKKHSQKNSANKCDRNGGP